MRRSAALAALTLIVLVAPAAPVPGALDEDRVVLTPRTDDVLFEVEAIPARVPDRCEELQPSSFHAKYRGSLEIVPQGGGKLRIINDVSFPDYLAGIAEVPLSWPRAALRAQVIAARSYAMDAYLRGRAEAAERGYHICSTVNCQVYRGAAVELGAFGERWVEAVRSTEGRILRYRGGVVQSFYFSTSNGRTRTSFPGGSRIPWAKSVDGMDEDAPLGHWRAPIPLDELGEMLGTPNHDGDVPPWSGGRVRRVEDIGDSVRLVGERGSLVMSKPTFSASVNTRSRCIFPDRYPNPTGSQSGGRLPSTIPSSSFTARMRGDRVVIRGRGWGHFIGMSQYGAYYLAEDGRSTKQILKHFYDGARLGRIEEPSSIRVLAAEDLRQVRIRVLGRADVTTGRGSRLAPGTRFTISRGDPPRIVRGSGPRARGVLEVTPLDRELTVADTSVPARIRFEASRPVRVVVEVLDAGGTVVARTPERSFESGRRAVRLPLDALGDAGTYQVVIEGYDGLDRVRTAPVPLVLGSAAAPTPPPSTPGSEPAAGTRAGPIAAGVAVLVLALAALGVWLSRR